MKQKNHDKIGFIAKIEHSDNRWGWMVLFLYTVAVFTVGLFHEPWFDEAQSWIIARDSSLRDIIFLIPHYEGHPPLWHLYLMPFAKSGMPYELGLQLSAILINVIAMWIIIFKAPFKKIIRYLIPFTYYFFYLYGVLSRCYSMTMLGFMLMAVTYKGRNSKPWGYVLSMLLVSLSTAYGLLFSAGAALVWLIEIAKKGKLKDLIPRFIKDKRFYALAALLVFAVIIVLLIMPRENTFAANLEEYSNPLLARLFYMFILAPIDATFFNSISGNFLLMYATIRPNIIIIGTLLFSVLFSALYLIGIGYKKLSMLVVPYIFFAVFASGLYFSEHHISIIAYFLLFWLWICFDSDQAFVLPEKLSSKLTQEDRQKAKKLLWILPAVLIGFPLYWNISACTLEFSTNYSSSTETAEFISEHEMQDKLIMIEWIGSTSEDDSLIPNINHQRTPIVLAYFDKNIIYTFYDGDDNHCFNHHILPTKAEALNAYEKWRSLGAPDVLIGHPDLYGVFGEQVTLEDYTLVKVIKEKRISKDDFYRIGRLLYIYVRSDLIEYYGLQPEDEEYWTNMLTGKVEVK